MTKIITYNVNGIRAAINKGLIDWLKAANPDILCLQETKARPEQVDLSEFEKLGYTSYWENAEKKGYSGVAIFTKYTPKNVVNGCGIEKYDAEGRVIRVDFKDFSVISLYLPSGTSGEERQDFKYEFLDDFYDYISELKKTIPNLIISGDYNICHKEIDIHNPVSNANSSGFLPPEREWVTKFLSSGFVDSFRHLNKEPDNYSWWTYRFNARNRNLGWRIDYNMVSEPLQEKISRVAILKDAHHSDHCPVLLEVNELSL